MQISRRAFFGTAPALPLALAPPQSSFDPWVEVNAANVRHNVGEIARLTGRPILAVIKNNGYGAGVVEIARLLEPIPAVRGFAVVRVGEAGRLRSAGIRKPVLLMGPFDDRQIGDLAANDVTLMIYTPPGPAFDRAAGQLRRPIVVHVCVDTGIGRVGVPYRQAADYIRALQRRPAIRAEGIMMTFTEDAAFDREQLARFQALSDTLTAEGLQLGMRHAASTYPLFQHRDAFLDLVRPGMAIYGVYPEASFRAAGILALRPALALRARVVLVKQLRKGESAGYGRAYVAPRDIWIATLPIGHVDGVPRTAANKARVRIGAALYPIVASVSASHTLVEIGDEARVKIGDVATVFDWQEGSRPEDVSAASGASVYDLLMHLSPFLERRVV